jgi:hypothetical protein
MLNQCSLIYSSDLAALDNKQHFVKATNDNTHLNSVIHGKRRLSQQKPLRVGASLNDLSIGSAMLRKKRGAKTFALLINL